MSSESLRYKNYKNTVHLFIVFLRSILQLLVTVNVAPSSLIIFTLMMEAICFSEASVLTTATRRNTPEDDIFHSHRRENLKSYVIMLV
jgi:hypothetical protein